MAKICGSCLAIVISRTERRPHGRLFCFLIKNRGNKFDKNAKKDIHESNEKHLIESYEAACELAKDYRWDEIRCVKERKTQNKRRYRRRDI